MSPFRGFLQRSLGVASDSFCNTRYFQSYARPRVNSYHRVASSGIPSSHKDKESYRPLQYSGNRILPLSSVVGIQQFQTDSKRFSTRSLHGSSLVTPVLSSRYSSFYSRAYSSHSGGNQDGPLNVSSEASDNSINAIDNSMNSDWVDSIRKSATNAASSLEDKVKVLTDEYFPQIQQLYDSHPYLEKVVVPVGGTLTAAMVAWFIMPKIFRRIHKYAAQSPFGSLSLTSATYEKSLWGALEDPARYLVTFIAFSQLGAMIAPTTAQYLSQAWRGAAVLSFVWFLHRWKTNVFSIAMANKVTGGIDRDKMIALESVSSVGLLILGVMALAEACGVAVQSILTVGGIGGVATAFAARDILGNLLSGLSVQFSRPFTLGDTIKAGSVEGQVVEMGLTTTSLLNPEKFPVIVPNSLLSSQVIINKSRAQWRASLIKIPLDIDDLEKIPAVSGEIKSMLQSNPNVFLGKDAPYCYLSRIENSFAELTLGCNLRNMRKDELYAAEQEILLQAARIIKQHGARLGSTYDFNNR